MIYLHMPCMASRVCTKSPETFQSNRHPMTRTRPGKKIAALLSRHVIHAEDAGRPSSVGGQPEGGA